MKLANHNPDTLAAAIEKAHDRQDHIEKALVRLANLQTKAAAQPQPALVAQPVAVPQPVAVQPQAAQPAAAANDGTGLIVDPQQAAVTAAVAAFANGQ